MARGLYKYDLGSDEKLFLRSYSYVRSADGDYYTAMASSKTSSNLVLSESNLEGWMATIPTEMEGILEVAGMNPKGCWYEP